MKYCDSPYHYKRRETRPVVVGDPSDGGVVVGGSEPIVRQSMLTCSTLDTDASIEQSMALVGVGCQLQPVDCSGRAETTGETTSGFRRRCRCGSAATDGRGEFATNDEESRGGIR